MNFDELADNIIELNQLILDSMDLSVCVIDSSGKLLLTNEKFHAITGYTKKEVDEDLSAFDLVAEEDRERLFYMIEQLQEGVSAVDLQFNFIKSDGSYIYISTDITPLHNKEGDVTGFLTVSYDLTGRKGMDEEIIKNAKLESLGVLAGGLAHNFRNILMGIIGNVSLLQLDPHISSDQREAIDEIYRASIRATELTNQLSTFARGGEPITRPTSILDLVEEASSLILSGSSCKAQLEIEEKLPAVEVDPSLVSQLLNNIILNADQAMPQGGIITIKIARELITPASELPITGDFVRISINDDGIGIREGIKDKVYDPYFSTKSEGTGLGLASSYSIAKKHGGCITFDSVYGEGTTFHVYLPVSREFEEDEEGLDIDTTQRIHGRVLLMDDDDQLLRTAKRMLQHMGLEVTTVHNGYEAISEYGRSIDNGKRYGLVILDVTVPGTLGGKETMEKLREIDPHVIAIISSGYSDEPILTNYQKLGFRDKLSKPYEYKQLLITVQRNIS